MKQKIAQLNIILHGIDGIIFVLIMIGVSSMCT